MLILAAKCDLRWECRVCAPWRGSRLNHQFTGGR